jgi:hypothetical protein
MCDVKAPFDGTLKFQKGSFPSLWRVGDGPFELADSPVPNSSAAPLPLPSHVGLAAAKPQAHGTGTATATQRRASPPPASSPADPRLLVPTSPAHGSQSRLLHAPHVALTASPARGTGRGDADAPQRGRTGRRGGAGRRTCTCTGDRPAGPHHAAVFPNFICSFRQESGQEDSGDAAAWPFSAPSEPHTHRQDNEAGARDARSAIHRDATRSS